ncbi:MAG: hypothetical protein ACOWWR_01245 [Eubacteriales bacterium]
MFDGINSNDRLADTDEIKDELDILLSHFEETSGEGELSPERLAELARKAPEPAVVGNEQLEILDHYLNIENISGKQVLKGISIKLKNKTPSTIGRAVINTTFYDKKGNVIDEGVRIIKDIGNCEIFNIVVNPPCDIVAAIQSYYAEVTEVILTPLPVVNGNNIIEILKHNFIDGDNTFGCGNIGGGINISIKNISDKTVAMALFDAIVYDSEGNILECLKHKEVEIKPYNARAITIRIDNMKCSKVKSYLVNLTKTITIDREKVQLRQNEMRTIESDLKEVTGTIKNISEYKTDAVVIATFFNISKEEIGKKVLKIVDIDPNSIRKFNLTFYSAENTVKTYSLDIGEIIQGEIIDITC